MSSATAALVVIAAMIATATLPAGDSRAAFPGKNGDLFFTNGGAMYSISATGGHRQKLGRGGSALAVGPNANRVAFTRRPGHVSQYDIWIMRADGSHQKQLTSGKLDDDSPSFSSDGKRIAFGRKSDIWVMDPNGKHAKALTPSHDSYYEPVFSPDGKTLLFSSGGAGLFTMSAPGGPVTQITTDQDYSPSFSPDGQTIVFSSDRDGGPSELYHANADGTNQLRLTFDDHSDNSPAFSPDGQQIAFTHFTGSTPPLGEDGDVFETGPKITVMKLDGSNREQLASGFAPDWATK
jgi:Tol biopolymer transport system component